MYKQQADVFLHDSAHAMWNFKGAEGPRLSILVTFLRKKISTTL
jgi:hypothetical protein